ncbi:MAG TPA: hypothetical protein VK988_19920 [Acidimicrobiales bacterium]|nr:hypothetical protein [Acidimicrobiales bacterium]
MRQSAFTILTHVKAEVVADLERLLTEIGDDIDENPHLRFADLDNLHYASLFVVADGASDPYLVFEGNIDGRPREFLDMLLERARGGVDKIYRHCVDYPVAGAQDRAVVLDYLEAHDIGANTFYVAWPGWTVDDICKEQALRDHIERFIDDQEGADLRQRLPQDIRQRIADYVHGEATMAWARTARSRPFLVKNGKTLLRLCLAPPALGVLWVLKAARSGASTRRRRFLGRAILVSILGLAGSTVRQLRKEEIEDERRDRLRVPDWQTTYARWTEEEELPGIVRREDVKVQNHMVSVTRIKEGRFRLQALRLVLWAINLIARLTANKGSLGGISSIHFARWVITPDDKTLLFMSNFDGSWERYLNDFIDLAAEGLTAVWTNTDNAVGFPRTKWLVTAGARDEARFKAYARFSMVPTHTWYSAYPGLTVSNIDNNMRIRQDLFASLDPAAAEAWLRRF